MVAAFVSRALRKWNRAGWILTAATIVSIASLAGLGENPSASWLGWLGAPGGLAAIMAIRALPDVDILVLFAICLSFNIAFWFVVLGGTLKLREILRKRGLAQS